MGIDERLHHLFADDPGARVHLYGKQVRPGRKIGHVTVVGNDMHEVRQRARHAARWLADGPAQPVPLDEPGSSGEDPYA
jgi:5-(carboxyamino)imidazole ribonucleotide synthase